MIYIGLAIAALGIGVFLYDYTESLRKTKDSYVQICEFLVHVRGEIEGSAKPIDKIVREYYRGRETSLIAGAFSSLPGEIDLASLCILGEDRERIRIYFKSFGTAPSKEEELRRLNALILPIEQKRDLTCERTGKRIKSFYLIYAAALLSAVLLVC